MGIADLFITKSGSISVCEGIYMQVPMLLDATSTHIQWEQFNHSFIQNHGFGSIITNYNQISKMVMNYLREKKQLASIKKNLANFKKRNGGQEVKKLIAHILQVDKRA